MKKFLLALPVLLQMLLLSATSFAYKGEEKHIPTVMNQVYLEQIVKTMASKAKGGKGFVEFTFADVQMYLVSDASHNRMRIITPIAEYKKLTSAHLQAVLESNFHKALDARYAVSDGVLYSVFVHPLSSLTEDQIRSAVFQVANLALSFGSDYSSGVLDFGGSGE